MCRGYGHGFYRVSLVRLPAKVTDGNTREWRNRQTRTVQVRVPARAWGFNSPLAHLRTIRVFGSWRGGRPLGGLVFVLRGLCGSGTKVPQSLMCEEQIP